MPSDFALSVLTWYAFMLLMVWVYVYVGNDDE